MNDIQDHLIVAKGPRLGEKIPLINLPITVGRDEAAEVYISLENVSRKHLRIAKNELGYVIEDLNSSNGTFVNGVRIDKPTQIKNGDVIALGPTFEARVVIPVVQTGDATLVGFDIAPKTIGQAPDSDATAFMPSAVDTDKTMAFIKEPPKPAIPPSLIIQESGKEPKVFTLTMDRLRIGRQDDNDIVLNNRFVSRYHASLEKRGQDYYIIPAPNVSNPLLLDGVPVMEPTRLEHGTKIRFGGFSAGEMMALDYISPDSESASQHKIKFTENRLMTIGRNPSNDIVLPAPTVSQFHAEIEKVGQRYRLRDLRSSNGTFVNGKSVSGENWVQIGDAIQIGPFRFVVDENEFSQSDQSRDGVSVDIIGVNKWVSKSLNILQDISLSFKPKEFIVVVGQSGGGKSTLVDAIAGYRPATHGRIVVNKSIDVYKEFDSIRSTIGYVPQKDIIHMELTVFQALDYAAQLRMPADTTVEERKKRVDEVMKDLDLAHRKDTQISRLSGGQQKRVSIGVELLTKPGFFFLDEPTSGLDPGMETELMRLMRRLADQGRTIVMVTHATKNVMLADKVVFLARGGYLTWFGPPEEALAYFDKYRTERDRRANAMEFDHIYTLLDDPELGSGAEWAERFRNDRAYQLYISEPLQGESKDSKTGTLKPATKPLAKRNQVSSLRQFFILSKRNVKIITRDWFTLVLLLVTAPLMASLDFMLASGVGRNPFGFESGSFNDVVSSLIVLTNTTMLVGGLSFMRELVKERDIYKRERMVNLKLFPYIMSKIWVALVLAVYQTTCYVAIRYLAFDMPGGIEELILFFVTVYLLITAGMMLGLFASALAPNSNAAPLLLIMFIIPQMVLSGAMMPFPAPIRAPASSSWAFQAIIGIGGTGSDVDGDVCWNLSDEERDALTLDEKNERCDCMGENALRENFCSFPGLGEYYDEAIDQPDPVEPIEPGPQPEEPILPEKPAEPRDLNNVLALQIYLNALNEYTEEVNELQDEYKAAIDAWQEEQERYKEEIQAYQEELLEIKVKRAIAVGAAEASIDRYKKDFGWTFLDKDDRGKYLGTIFTTWGAQILIITVVFFGTIYMQKRRDVV